MPKYSTVQAYSDNSANVQTVSYEQASGGGGSGGDTAHKGPGMCVACVYCVCLLCVVLDCDVSASSQHTSVCLSLLFLFPTVRPKRW
jgi:hypothetical protein